MSPKHQHYCVTGLWPCLVKMALREHPLQSSRRTAQLILLLPISFLYMHRSKVDRRQNWPHHRSNSHSSHPSKAHPRSHVLVVRGSVQAVYLIRSLASLKCSVLWSLVAAGSTLLAPEPFFRSFSRYYQLNLNAQLLGCFTLVLNDQQLVVWSMLIRICVKLGSGKGRG